MGARDGTDGGLGNQSVQRSEKEGGREKQRKTQQEKEKPPQYLEKNIRNQAGLKSARETYLSGALDVLGVAGDEAGLVIVVPLRGHFVRLSFETCVFFVYVDFEIWKSGNNLVLSRSQSSNGGHLKRSPC